MLLISWVRRGSESASIHLLMNRSCLHSQIQYTSSVQFSSVQFSSVQFSRREHERIARTLPGPSSGTSPRAA
jgi:hypothetical protein